MKKKFRFLLLPGMVALSFLYYAFQFSSATTPVVSFTPQTTSNKPIKVDFSPSLPTLTNSGAKWKVFYSLGDGRFWMGDYDTFKSTSFYYDYGVMSNTSIAKKTFVEYMAIYDDTINPDRIAAPSPSIDPTAHIPSGDDELKVNIAASKAIKLQSTCEPSNGDIITYIITRQAPTSFPSQPTADYTGISNGKFVFDASVLDYVGNDNFSNLNSIGRLPDAGVSVNGAWKNEGKIAFEYKGLSSNQQSIFLYFKTKTTAHEGGPYFVPYTTLECQSRGGGYTQVDTDTLSAERIKDTHDPNHKFALPLINEEAQSLDFTISFQNEGADSTKHVWVEDKLDTLFDYKSIPTVVTSTGCKIKPVIRRLKPNERSYIIDFGDLHLRGLQEKGLGHEFTEEQTKASVTINCVFRSNTLENWKASAALNQARVRFDCNPLFNTNVSQSIIMCMDASTVHYDTINVSTLADTANAVASVSSFLAPFAFTTFKWYPTTGLLSPLSMHPSFQPDAKGTYTLVASKCDTGPAGFQEIAFVTVNIASPLKITVDKCQKPGFLVASVSGYTGSNPGTDLKWSNCATGSTMQLPVIEGKKSYYFGVTDLSTGNDAEIFYKPDSTICPVGPGWFAGNTGLLIALIVIALLMLLYLLRRFFKFP